MSLQKLIALTACLSSLARSQIDYSEHGKNWADRECGLEEQSPINIDPQSLVDTPAVSFKMINYQDITTATVSQVDEKSAIRIEYPQVEGQKLSDLQVTNELGQTQVYHLQYMEWHVPSEHTIFETQYSAELQLYHVQFATNKVVAISFLFDKELETLAKNSGKKPKTCFVDSFRVAEKVANGPLTEANDPLVGVVEIPLREFIEYVPQDRMVWYHGSKTVPECSETVSWIINMSPHVITKQQIDDLNALLSPDIVTQGGNYRNIQSLSDERKVYKFNNYGNQGYNPMSMDAAVSTLSLGLATSFFMLLQL